jgi:DtxR family Mn-dependent transcriptional regulator
VSCISDDSNSSLLRYLASLGLLPGTVVTVTDIAPFEGPLTIEVDTQQHIIGRKAAVQVYVEAR